ncbi:MAG: hypothetical protein WCF22_16590, partial [Candidatus Sulfotelmatobacter sp.]
GLFYASRWSSTEKAAKFAAIYARSLSQRYKQAEEVKADASDQASTKGAQPNADLLQGRHEWKTEEGAVVIEEKGDTVLISESLDPATTQTLEREVLGN